MGKFCIAIILVAGLCLTFGSALADWDPGDPYKMEEPMYPNEYGWNVYASDGAVLADDWRCTETGPVNDIHFWGSWKDGLTGTINGFTITIYSDIPEDPPSLPYSRPGAVVWGPVYITEFATRAITPDPEAWEGWVNPFDALQMPLNHNNFFQYNITNIADIPGIPDPFEQVQGSIYWLAITADVEISAASPQPEWGWKSSYVHWMDDAVADEGAWVELYEPDPGATVNEFGVQIDPAGGLVSGYGAYSYDNTWFWYTDDDPGWWNIWFYDHPLALDRWKEVFVAGSYVAQTMGLPGEITIAINWSTPQWSETGNPPGQPRRPPLPGDLAGTVPGTYLMRQIIWQGPVTDIPTALPDGLGYTIDQYNPEWVSIDVQGTNFNFEGAISHACIGVEPQSMDLSFIITNDVGEPTGACCWPQGTCSIETQSDCESAGGIGGTYMGDGVTCSGDGDGNGVDDLCENVTAQGACCMTDGTCYVTSAALCAAAGGTYKSNGTACLGDADGDGVDDVCEDPPGACCMDDGSCVLRTAAGCLAEGGDYQGDGSICLGDTNPVNGVDDACETAPELKWFQEPDLSPGGMDVSAFYHEQYGPYVLATDFLCTSPGPITEIHIFGSWYLDKLPLDDPRAVSFNLSLHADIPDPDGPGPEYSMPGQLICFMPDAAFEVRVYEAGLQEGWLEPPDYYTPYPQGDAVCWEYIFHLDGTCIQEGSTDLPIVYWIDLQAYPDDPEAFFGWKTAVPPEWNDDAVWAIGIDDPTGAPAWQELVYPPNHPYHETFRSIDLAFAVYGEPLAAVGACCFDDGSCVDAMTSAACVAAGGSYGGDGTTCAGTDLDQNGVDDFCDGVVTLGACCYGDPLAPSCVNTTQYICELAGGGYAGTWYAGMDCGDAAFQCPVAIGACCYEDGTCVGFMSQSACEASGGEYGGDGTNCATTDSDQNGIDDFCDDIVTLGACCYGDPTAPTCVNTTQTLCGQSFNGTWYSGQDCASFTCPLEEDQKWLQPPDLSDLGMDIFDMSPIVLADDFECRSTGRITKVEVWGSWWMDEYPTGGPGDLIFDLSIHQDIPATSTVIFPAGCPYVSLTGTWDIIQGLPQGTEINSIGRLEDFTGIDRAPGGQLGGEMVTFDATLTLQMTGTGALAGFARTVAIPVACEVHTACVPPEPCHDFDMILMAMQGQVVGDADFDWLGVQAGNNYGLPSPGHTTLTKLPSGDFMVDSFFDVTYQIDFTGSAGSAIEGMSGSTLGTVNMEQVDPTGGPDCVVPDEGEASRPGEQICLYTFAPGSFTFEPAVEPGQIVEGWYDPTTGEYLFPGDRNCWKYTFEFPGDCIQYGTPQAPVVYWLDLQANYSGAPQSVYFGWKTTVEHWNDDAVYGLFEEPGMADGPWYEMWYPPTHQLYGQSIDLAFAIYGAPDADTCAGQLPGDYDSDGDIDYDDLNDLTDWVNEVAGAYPASPPANGDFNGDCRVNQYDVTAMTGYLATGGPPPVDCTCLNPYGSCCIGTVGNVNLDPLEQVTIGDISVMIDHLFINNPVLPCVTEADINQSGGPNPTQGAGGDITIGDISVLIDHLFISGPAVLILNDCF